MSTIKLLQMVQIRDLKRGDVLATEAPNRRLAVGSDETEAIAIGDEIYWWGSSSLFLRVNEIVDGRTIYSDLQLAGDEHMRVGVWR